MADSIQTIMRKMGAVDKDETLGSMSISPQEVREAENADSFEEMVRAGLSGQHIENEQAKLLMEQGAKIGAGLGQALRPPSEAEQLADMRTGVLEKLDPNDAESLKIGSRFLLDMGDTKGAFALANRAGKMEERSIELAGKKATTAKTEEETRLLGAKTTAAFDRDVEAIMARTDLSDKQRNAKLEELHRARIAEIRGKGKSKRAGRAGTSATRQERLQAQELLTATGLNKDSFDNEEDFTVYRDTVASAAKALLKADDPVTKDFGEAMDIVLDEFESQGVLKNTGGTFPTGVGFGDEFQIDKKAIAKARARLSGRAPAKEEESEKKGKGKPDLDFSQPKS